MKINTLPKKINGASKEPEGFFIKALSIKKVPWNGVVLIVRDDEKGFRRKHIMIVKRYIGANPYQKLL